MGRFGSAREIIFLALNAQNSEGYRLPTDDPKEDVVGFDSLSPLLEQALTGNLDECLLES